MALAPVQQFLPIELHALRVALRFDGTTGTSTLGFLGVGVRYHTNHCPHGHFLWKQTFFHTCCYYSPTQWWCLGGGCWCASVGSDVRIKVMRV